MTLIYSEKVGSLKRSIKLYPLARLSRKIKKKMEGTNNEYQELKRSELNKIKDGFRH